ncbi:hypothetical protein [Arsenophonus apicola]|uniref:Tox-PLDMTX domain-containing protein n=1 Tax=Arsenophonus apicola TaxID=2879119 RepID=A0ABY8P297_9GAMM|nr:hypothetical protein [Arsenophonus apicola]WGO82940.1 hypothetical protein QG404_11375 [Arsenophonus apicola]
MMKILNNNLNVNYIPFDNKVSNEGNINDEQVTVINSGENKINTDSLYSFTNQDVFKERVVRDVFPTEATEPNEPNFQSDALLNLLKRIKENIIDLINIKDTAEYLKLKKEIFSLQLKITNDKKLSSAIKNAREVYQSLRKDIYSHELTNLLYRKILFLAEKSSSMNYIYELGFQINKLHIADIIEKIEQMEETIAELTEINKCASLEEFNNHKESLIHDIGDILLATNLTHEFVKDHFFDLVKQAIDKKMSDINPIPIGFQLHNILQEVLNDELKNTDAKDEKKVLEFIYKSNAINNLFSIKYNFNNKLNSSYDILKVFALSKINDVYETDKHVFGELSIEDIINTEIIYSYTTNNQTHYSTFTIFDYLVRHVIGKDSPLITRSNINIKFPNKFSSQLIKYLDEEALQIKKELDLVKNIDLLKEKKDKLQEKMPNLETYLKTYLAKISKEHNVSHTSLNDLVECRYIATSFNPELNAAINNYHPPVEKLYTVRDILLGKERKWLSENTNYKLDEVLSALYPTQYTTELISKINSTDIQNSYIAEMEEVKKSKEIKELFNDFRIQLLTTYGKKDVLYYLVEDSPGLLIFSDKDSGPVTGIDKMANSIDLDHTPIAVISIFTGECLHYPSFRDFKHAINASEKLKLWITAHFTNYSEINPSQLKLKRENQDYSFLFEDIINFNIKKADVLVRSHKEALLFELFERFKDITFPYTFFTFLMGNIPGIVYGSVLSATPSFLQASISDTEAEYKNYLKEGVINIIAETLGVVVPEAIIHVAKGTSKGINLYAKYKFNQKILQIDKNAIQQLANDFHHSQNNLRLGVSSIKNENQYLLEIKPAFKPNNLTNDIPATEYLTELQFNPSTAQIINNPTAEDNVLMSAVALFMRQHGMVDIKYRGIYIWQNVKDETPITHFAVVGKKEDKNYIFDLTAERFKNISNSNLDGPLILEESVWENRYRQAFANSVVRYNDFVNEEIAEGSFKKYLNLELAEAIKNSTALTTPAWYTEQLTGQKNFIDKFNSLINNNSIHNILHEMYWYNNLPKDNINYIAEVLYQANILLNKENKEKLVEALSKILQNENIKNSESLWLQALDNYRQIDTMDELLFVKPGEIIFFNNQEGKLVSMMVSLGNGLFSSLENNKLCPYIKNNNGIIMAEQIGLFVQGQLEQYTTPVTKLNAYVGQAKVSQIQHNSLNEVVEKSLKEEVVELPEYMAGTLKEANELSDEQALIFYEDLKLLRTDNNKSKSVRSILSDVKPINSATQLSSLPTGRLVVFYDLDYELKSMMISLGDGKFVISNGASIGMPTKKYNDIISASQFEKIVNGKLHNTNVISGSVNVQGSRQEALLGKDAIFNIEGNRLFIKTQGIPSSVNYMDGPELSNIIEGLAIQSLGFKNWQKVEVIELQSCFGPFGSIPIGQVIAHKLNKKVIIHPFSAEKGFGVTNQPLAPMPKIYEAGVYLSEDDLKLASEQSYLNTLFWQQLLFLFENTNKLLDIAESIEDALEDKITLLILDLVKLISKKITIDKFLQLHPEYYAYNGELGKYLFPKIDRLLKIKKVTNADEFAELMIEFLSLSNNSYTLLDKFMGVNIEAVKSLNQRSIEGDFKK